MKDGPGREACLSPRVLPPVTPLEVREQELPHLDQNEDQGG